MLSSYRTQQLARMSLAKLIKTYAHVVDFDLTSTETSIMSVVPENIEEPEPRVLSIQSHVVHGYVGNKMACFPLQLFGFDVDCINSVQFSNHTQYQYFKGQTMKSDQLNELMLGLKLNHIDQYSHLLTGYAFCDDFLLRLRDIVKDLRQTNSDIIYVCDPVMGDHGKLYVPENLVPIYRDHIIPIADVITPNQFEAELLTGVKITTEADLITAVNILHDMGAKTVVITSAELGVENQLTLMGSSSLDGTKFTINFPVINGHFTGTGDLTAALLTAWLFKTNGNLKISCEKMVATLRAVLKRTKEYCTKWVGSNPDPPSKYKELRLIQSKEDIENPLVEYCAEVYGESNGVQ